MSRDELKARDESKKVEDNEGFSVGLFRGSKGKKGGQWQIVGYITNNSITLVDQEIRLGKLKIVAIHERRILCTLMDVEGSFLNQPYLYYVETKDHKETLSSYLIDSMQFRHGTVYIMVQVSSSGIRLICYGTNKIHHQATGFWTSPMDNVTQTELEDRMSEAIKNLKNHKNPYLPKTVCEVIQAGFIEFHC